MEGTITNITLDENHLLIHFRPKESNEDEIYETTDEKIQEVFEILQTHIGKTCDLEHVEGEPGGFKFNVSNVEPSSEPHYFIQPLIYNEEGNKKICTLL